MTNFEDRLRELAEAATPGQWFSDFCHVGPSCWCKTIANKKDSDDLEHCVIPSGAVGHHDADHIAFNDPETAKLVADVIAAVRSIDRDGGLNSLGLSYSLRDKMAVLDAHHARREGK